jgi:hypothetical protein
MDANSLLNLLLVLSGYSSPVAAGGLLAASILMHRRYRLRSTLVLLVAAAVCLASDLMWRAMFAFAAHWLGGLDAAPPPSQTLRNFWHFLVYGGQFLVHASWLVASAALLIFALTRPRPVGNQESRV